MVRQLARVLRGYSIFPILSAVLVMTGFAIGPVHGEEFRIDDQVTLDLSGYVREYVSMNLDNKPETSEDDKFSLQMVRTQIRLDVGLRKIGPIELFTSLRGVKEVSTGYLEDLEDAGADSSSNDPDLVENRYDDFEARELYADIDILPYRLSTRLGKQQVAWGETDFFQASDLIHGFDFTWRSFLEAENEELRKPLIMANVMLQVPEADGSLQGIIIPGLDRDQDIGNSFDLFGGRWANQPNKGFDFFTVLENDFNHPDGDKDDVKGGVRWQGILGDVNYSLMYLRTHNPDPVISPSSGIGGEPFGGKEPSGALGDLVYPIVDTVGATGSYYSPFLDIVFSTELAYTFDKPYNFGSDFLGGNLPGFGGVEEKDTLRWMVRGDYQFDTQNILGTHRPSFLSVQLFDSWLVDYDKDDDIVNLAGYGARKKEHSLLVTGIWGLNYFNDRVNPSFAGGYDISYGGGFFIPSIEFVLGDHFRLKFEADLFFTNGTKSQGEIEDSTNLFGYFANNNQFLVRGQYQF